jgi:hypothetical protein
VDAAELIKRYGEGADNAGADLIGPAANVSA